MLLNLEEVFFPRSLYPQRYPRMKKKKKMKRFANAQSCMSEKVFNEALRKIDEAQRAKAAKAAADIVAQQPEAVAMAERALLEESTKIKKSI